MNTINHKDGMLRKVAALYFLLSAVGVVICQLASVLIFCIALPFEDVFWGYLDPLMPYMFPEIRLLLHFIYTAWMLLMFWAAFRGFLSIYCGAQPPSPFVAKGFVSALPAGLLLQVAAAVVWEPDWLSALLGCLFWLPVTILFSGSIALSSATLWRKTGEELLKLPRLRLVLSLVLVVISTLVWPLAVIPWE